ncbi:hypothetical protein [uncultured Brevibacterium sp.]|uniref:hypothetical protein n=1 Tax=uncultured Brevibacterium sp. TaxID=189678 RepID=UPI0025F27012|nr:hypothetical protein [uncultured Brevibacterium sp.]
MGHGRTRPGHHHARFGPPQEGLLIPSSEIGARPARRARTRAVALVLAVVLLALIAFAALTTVRVNALIGHLEAASAAAEDYMMALAEDPAALPGHLDRARSELDQAEAELAEVPLAQLTAVPWLGRNLTATATAVDQMQVLTEEVAPVLSDAAVLLDFETLRLRDPGSTVGEWRTTIEDSVDVIRAAPGAIDRLGEVRTAISEIDTDGLLPAVRDAIEELELALDDAYGRVAPVRKTFSDLQERVQDGIENFDLLDLIRNLV